MNINNNEPDTDGEDEKEEKKQKKTRKPANGKKRSVPADAAIAEPVEKKARAAAAPVPAPGKYRFFLQFDQVSGFRVLTNILMNLLEEIEFTIIRTPNFQGIQFNLFVGGNTAFVSGSQSLTVQELAGDKVKFSVSLADFGNSIKAIAHTAVTQIYQALDDNHVVIEALDSMTQKVMRFRLPTLAVETESENKLDNQTFDFTLEFPLGELDRVCKSAATFGSKDIGLELLKKSDQDMYIRLFSKGRVELSEYFKAVIGASGTIRASNAATVSAFDEDDAAAVASSQPIKSDFSDYRSLINGSFHVDSINKFIKPLEKNYITIFFRLAEVAPHCMCICFQHTFSNNLVGDHDRIRYVVAAKVDDNESSAS